MIWQSFLKMIWLYWWEWVIILWMNRVVEDVWLSNVYDLLATLKYNKMTSNNDKRKTAISGRIYRNVSSWSWLMALIKSDNVHSKRLITHTNPTKLRATRGPNGCTPSVLWNRESLLASAVTTISPIQADPDIKRRNDVNIFGMRPALWLRATNDNFRRTLVSSSLLCGPYCERNEPSEV